MGSAAVNLGAINSPSAFRSASGGAPPTPPTRPTPLPAGGRALHPLSARRRGAVWRASCLLWGGKGVNGGTVDQRNTRRGRHRVPGRRLSAGRRGAARSDTDIGNPPFQPNRGSGCGSRASRWAGGGSPRATPLGCGRDALPGASPGLWIVGGLAAGPIDNPRSLSLVSGPRKVRFIL